MNHVIYYFSGTGNARYAAKTLADRLNANRLVPIASCDHESTSTDHDVAGVVSPVYMHRIPRIVSRFLSVAPTADYLYYVAVDAGQLGNVCDAAKRLTARRGQRLNAGFEVRMPSNYLPFGEAPQGAELDAVLAAADVEIERIADGVRAKVTRFPRPTGVLKRWIWPGLFYALGHRNIRYLDKSFTANDQCNGCGICAQLCPVSNIEIVDERPEWQHTCELCLACLNLCPQQAIEYGTRTVGLRRYRNPRVSLSELIVRKADE